MKSFVGGTEMELKKLRFFVKVAEAGGFRRAAEALNIAQPALTRQIQALEAEIGVPLLVRTAAGASPTPQGEIVLREAREILARADALASLVSRQTGKPAGEVRVGLPSALAEMLLSDLVRRVKSRYPEIRIICREGVQGQPENGEHPPLDLAIVSVASKSARQRYKLIPLMDEQDYLVTCRDLVPKEPSITIDEMLAMPLVLTPLPNARRRHLARIAQKRGTSLNIVAEAASMQAQLNLVRQGLGSAVLPLSAAQAMLRDKRVAAVAVDGLLSHRVLLMNPQSANPLATEIVADEIKSIFAPENFEQFVAEVQ